MKYLFISLLYVACALGPAHVEFEGLQMAGPLPLILMAAGTVISSVGMVKQGREQRKQMEQQARQTQSNALQDVYDTNYNAAVAEANEKESMYRAHINRQRIRRKGKQQMSGLTAQLQRQGLDLGSVSFEDVLSTAAIESEMAQADETYKAYQAGVGFRSEAAGFRRKGSRAFTIGQVQARGLRRAGASAETSAYFKVAGNLASNLGSSLAQKPTG